MKVLEFSGAAALTLSFILSLVNLRQIFHEKKQLRRLADQTNRGVYEDDPLLERLPGHIETVAMVIRENNNFSLVDDTAWAKTMPGQRGFVRLGPKGRSFALATYHQLHCINGLRFEYTVARDGLVTDPDTLRSKVPHDNHCFQFIRQSILCKADDTLIPVHSYNESLAKAAYGVVHQCRNWAQVRDFVLRNDEEWDGVPYLSDSD